MDDNNGCAIVIGIFAALGILGFVIENIGPIMWILFVIAVVIAIGVKVSSKVDEKKKKEEEAAKAEERRQQQLEELLQNKQKTWEELEDKYKD